MHDKEFTTQYPAICAQSGPRGCPRRLQHCPTRHRLIGRTT